MSVKYIAETAPVREVSLVGTADLDFWSSKLRQERLVPAPAAGRAQLLISGVRSQYMGIPFRELSISVLVESATGGQSIEYSLVHAFHSSRLLAFIERTCFSTPYNHTPLQVEIGRLAEIRLGIGGQLLRAESTLGETRDALAGSRDECMEIMIHLPSLAGGERKPMLFFARLAGRTTRFAFDPSGDILRIQPSPEHSVLGCLVESGFAASEWIIRPMGRHARSKTFARESPAATMPR